MILSGSHRYTNMIDIDAFREINHIIEHDATSSTYKYALLKATIDAVQKYEHLITIDRSSVSIPLGLIVDAWIVDYMPFVFANVKQQHSGLVFDKEIEAHYRNIFQILGLQRCDNWHYAYTLFVKSYKESIVLNTDLANEFFKLSKKIARKIVTMPMKYTGKSAYSVFQPAILRFGHIKKDILPSRDTGSYINLYGTFDISLEHYYIFRYLGHSLYGTSTIQSKWINKTLSLNQESYQKNDIEMMVGKVFDQRDTTTARELLHEAKECVWSGEHLTGSSMDIDHLLPYSIWFNNDLWNLLPAKRAINQYKRDKIPSSSLIRKRAKIIKYYWQVYETKKKQLFRSQLSLSLGAGFNHDTIDYDRAIDSLCAKSDYLIYDRGIAVFEL